MARFPEFEIRLHPDGDMWVARFNTLGGPDCMSQGETPHHALRRLSWQLECETAHFGGMDRIPPLPQVGVAEAFKADTP